MDRPLRIIQFDSQKGKSTIDALYAFTSRVEKAERTRQIAIAAVLDIEGALSKTPTESIFDSIESHGVGFTVNWWLSSVLWDRIV